MKYWAKSDPLKTVAEHTADLRNIWEYFLKIYPAAFDKSEQSLIATAIEYHDLGKLNDLFQEKIAININEHKNMHVSGEIPHGFLSCAYLYTREMQKSIGLENMEILLTAIYNHHTREDCYNVVSLKKYIEEYLPVSYTDEITNIAYELKDKRARYLNHIIPSCRNIKRTYWGKDKKLYLRYIVIKGMLNRIDYAASSDAKAMEIQPMANDFFKNKIQRAFTEKGLRPVQMYMLQRKDKNLIVIASTGCGKTEAALLWLDGFKTFYTLPLKVSINAIYERICKEYKYDKEKITLLHSGMLAYYFNQNDKNTGLEIKDDPVERQKKAKLLSFPLTVCTVDQLFYFVFKSIGSELIPATLKYSHLVIDEIQMYSPDILAYILYGLKIVTKLGGKFAIITATFPPVLHELMIENNIPFEMPSEKYYVDGCSSRHKITCIDGEFDYDLIFNKGQTYKVLVLCNTVKKAQQVYAEIQKYNDQSEIKVTVRLLHSRFIRKHRKILEEAIINDAQNDTPVIWVSTQIVEASLDIDYDILFTEMCPADSLLQRMGRCFRKRNYNADYLKGQPNVYIYNTGNGVGSNNVYQYLEIYKLSWELIQKYNDKIFDECAKFDYVDAVYNIDRLKNSKYYLKIKENMQYLTDLLPNSFNLSESHRLFRNIQSITILPDKFYNDIPQVKKLIEVLAINKRMALLERLRYEEKLREYTVDIPISNLNNKKLYIDKNAIKGIEKLDIHRAYCEYNFDEKLLIGLGILVTEIDNENRFI